MYQLRSTLLPRSDRSWLTARPIAHRGLHNASKGIFENSRKAFEEAISHNYTIECDLQLSGDGKAMVFHDATLERMTDATGKVADHDSDVLGGYSFTGGTAGMPTLTQLLDLVQGQVPLVIELKSLDDGSQVLARRVIKVMKEYKGPFSLMSFDPRQVATFAREAPEIMRGAVIHRETEKLWTEKSQGNGSKMVIEAIDPDFLSYSADAIPRPLTRKFRAAGKPVICWTIKDVETAKKVCQHCDQITFEGFLP